MLRLRKIYDNSEIRDFCDDIASSENFNGYKQIYTITKRGIRELAFFQDSDRVSTINFVRHNDYYITKNSFIADRRGNDYVFSFDNIVIDVDCHRAGKRTIDYEINKLMYVLDDYQSVLPRFNVVYSGRGVHLWIGLKSFSGKLSAVYKILCHHFCDELSRIIKENDIHLDVDYAASSNPSGIIRIPYTYNTHTDTKAVYEHRTDYKYSFQELLDEFPVTIDTTSTCAKPQTGFFGLNRKRLEIIQRVISDRQGECTGRRDKLIFLAYNATKQMYGERAKEMIEEINRAFTEPLTAGEIKGITTYIDKKGFLKFKNETFYSWILDEREREMYDKDYQEKKYTAEAMKERRAERIKRDYKIRELANEEMSVPEIAEKVGCCIKTVYNVLNAAPEYYKQREKKHREKVQRDERIKELRSKGCTMREIAAACECSLGWVSKVLTKH